MFLRKASHKEADQNPKRIPSSVNPLIYQLKSCASAKERKALLQQHCKSREGWQAVERAKNALETELNTQASTKDVSELRRCLDIFVEMESALAVEKNLESSHSFIWRIRNR